jgi:catechol 2,3-dioxygenase-like lactoylglutathione lyase family enzyme
MPAIARICAKHAALLLAVGILLQLATLRSPAQDTPKRPRITGIDHVRLYVSDIEKSRQFYSKLPGIWEGGYLCTRSPFPCFSVTGRQLQTLQLEKVPSKGVKSWLPEIAFATDNLEQMRRYLITQHMTVGPIATVINPYDKHALTAHFEVHDPEGNLVSFVQRFAFVPDDSRPNSPLLHAGFVVKDIGAENRFYLDLLGFKLYWYGGFNDDGVDWYEIQVPDGDNWIEYMLNIPANADHKELGVQNHFSLGVKDIHAAADQLRKNGLLKFDGPEIGRDGKWGLDVYDPDGTRVEVMEFTPAGKPCCHAYTAPHPTP